MDLLAYMVAYFTVNSMSRQPCISTPSSDKFDANFPAIMDLWDGYHFNLSFLAYNHAAMVELHNVKSTL